ncbi:MAG: phosphomannomutase [Deltaproteobacteria bacterium]|nr:MAG: phosphomannomutase [Deltaproteobacteria bacterium]
MSAHIFREYDIRGVADRDLPTELITDLGRALGTFWSREGRKRVAVARDCRLSSPRLHAALTEGLLETGLTLVDIGMTPTPLMYFTVFSQDLDGGVQITGSHNPPEDNGFKMMKGKASLYGQDVQVLRQMIEAQDFELPGGGVVETLDIMPTYAGYIRGNVRIARKDIRFAIDAGNGAAGPTAVAAMEAAGLSPVTLLCEPDGEFPVHHPDPSLPENLDLLRDKVLSEGLELGIAYDGDGDRIGVIDARGDVMWGDKLMVVYARALLKQRPGAAIIGEVKCSQTMYDDIGKHGGRPIMWKTGHSLIKAKMKEESALLAGEMSGHVFFGDRYYGFDDAVYATLRLLEIVAASNQPLHELIADLPETHVTPELRVPSTDDAKFAVVERVLAHYRESHDVVDIDGARIRFDGGWGLVRASNTQPVLVMRFEAETAERRDEIRREVEEVVAQASA